MIRVPSARATREGEWRTCRLQSGDECDFLIRVLSPDEELKIESTASAEFGKPEFVLKRGAAVMPINSNREMFISVRKAAAAIQDTRSPRGDVARGPGFAIPADQCDLLSETVRSAIAPESIHTDGGDVEVYVLDRHWDEWTKRHVFAAVPDIATWAVREVSEMRGLVDQEREGKGASSQTT